MQGTKVLESVFSQVVRRDPVSRGPLRPGMAMKLGSIFDFCLTFWLELKDSIHIYILVENRRSAATAYAFARLLVLTDKDDAG